MVETLALTVVALAGYAVLRAGEGAAPSSRRKGHRSAAAAHREPTVAARDRGLGWGLSALLLLPHVTLLVVALVPEGTWTTEALPPRYSLANFAALATEAERLRPLLNSLWMSGGRDGGAVAVAVLAGHLVVRRAVRLGRAIEWLFALPWVVRARCCRRAGDDVRRGAAAGRPFVLVGTLVILPLAYFVRSLPLTGRALLAGSGSSIRRSRRRRSPRRGRWRRLWRVTLPGCGRPSPRARASPS